MHTARPGVVVVASSLLSAVARPRFSIAPVRFALVLQPPGGTPRPPRAAPGAPQGRPREPQGSPKGIQELPEAPPRGENRGKNAPKIDFEANVGREPPSKPIFYRFLIEIVTRTYCESMANFEEKFRRSCHRSTKRCCENHSFTLVKTHFS